MAKKIAYLENGRSSDKFGGIAERIEQSDFDVDYYWAYNSEFPENPVDYDGIFLSGSAHGAYEDIKFIHDEHDFIVKAAKTDTPMLGVCFGSQILVSALCGRDQVFRRSICHVGYLDLDLTQAATTDPLMQGVDEQFRMLIWHNDEAKAGHTDMTILATTGEAPNQIWRYRDDKIWGIQGHPEVSNKNAVPWLDDVREYMIKDGVDVDKLAREFDDGKTGKKLIENFLSVCQKK